jgi:RNA polymerase sigma factor (sigma-70 family)
MSSTPLTPEAAFDRYRERLLSVIYLRMGRDLRVRMDPEDILQEVAIEAIRSWHTLDDPANAGAWLVTLAKRKIARVLRDQVGVAARDPRRERPVPTDFPVADRRSGPVTKADRVDRLALLEDALAKLRPVQREVVMRMKIEGHSAREVAADLGRSENAVHLVLSRAIKQLGREMNL